MLKSRGAMYDTQHNIVEFRSVGYEIAATRILAELDLTIEKGEILVLLGESGCGKTTTLKLINRLIEPSLGEVLIEGKSTTDWDAIKLRRKIGYVLQEGGLFPHFTVEENVALVPRLENREKAKTRAKVYELLDLVGLDHQKYFDRFP